MRETPEALETLAHNGTARQNVRAHSLRALSRVVVLVALDVVTSQSMRVVARVARDMPSLARVVGQRLDGLVAVEELGGLRFAGALVLGLLLSGAYGAGDCRRSKQRILTGCLVATLLPLWARVGVEPGIVALQLALDGAILGAAVLCARLLLDAVIYQHAPTPLARTVLVGSADDCASATANGVDAIGAPHGFAVVASVQLEALRALGVETLRCRLVEERADTVLLCGALDDDGFATVVRAAMMAECRVLATARRLALPGVRPQVLWRRGRPFVEMRAVTLRWQQLLIKRVLDLVLASVMLVCLAPVMAAVAALIAVSSPGPLLYGQRRLGRYGRSFRCYKFRSMFADAEERLANEPALHAEYVRNGFKLPDGEDPRITPLGRVLRRTSLDELPQLWNVVRGDMSLVGPRPIVPEEIRHYNEDGQLLLLLKPGITGLWQVSGRSELAYPARTNLELEYVERWSLGRDLGILARTVPAVLAQRGAH